MTLPDYAVEAIIRDAREASSVAFDRIDNAGVEAESMRTLPSFLLRPRLIVDGNQWCALYGENLQDGVAGFGDSPAAAFAAFDRAWHEKLPPRPSREENEP